MKKLSVFFLSLALAVVGGYGLTSCSSDSTELPPDPVPAPVPGDKPELKVGSVTPGNASVVLTASGISSYAYLAYAEADAPAKAPAAAVINATGTKGSCTEGENTIRIADATSPATAYVVYFALTTEKGAFYDEVLKVEFTTAAIEEVVALVQSKSDGLVVNLNVSEEMKKANHVLRYTFADWFTHQTHALGVDAFDLIYNSGKFVAESSTLILDNEHAVDDTVLGDDEEPLQYYNYMAPGEPILFIVGEYGWGNPPAGWSDGYYDFCFDYERYINSQNGYSAAAPLAIDIATDEDKYWTGYHSRHLFHTAMPETMTQKVAVQATNVTTTGFMINFIPDDGITHYCLQIADEQLYRDYTDVLGDESLWQWFVTSYTGLWEGCQTVMPQDGEEFAGPAVLSSADFLYGYPQAGATYHVMVTAVGSKDGMKQSFTHTTFQVPDYTLPAPKIVVTPLPEKSTDQFVYFNVRNANPGVPAVVVKTLCNYDREWDSAGSDYASMLASYGVVLSADDVAKINSEEGLEFEYSSRPNATSRMAVYAENIEGLANDLSAGTTAVADVRSKPRSDAPRVESSLFTELCGDWTATASVSVWNYDGGGYRPKAEPVSTKVTIAGGIEISESIPSGLAALYPLWSPERLAEMYNQYKEEGALFNRSVRGQNRLLCLGFNFEQDEWVAPRLVLQTPYDLLVHPTYNTPSVANIFEDFGPKWHLQIAEGDKVTLPINSEEFGPLSNWADRSRYTLVGYNEELVKMLAVNPYTTGEDDLTMHFPVEISADKNTITILPYEYEGKPFYPSVVYYRTTGYVSTGTIITSPIVLTRGWNGAAASSVRPNIYESTNSAANRIRMGRTPLQGKKITVLKKSPYADEARARMEKRMGR